MYKVLLVDDEPQIRQGLQAKIQWSDHGFEICGEASDGQEALQVIAKEHPHVVITDIRMPKMDGVELLKQCTVQFPELLFIVLSGYDDFAYVRAAIQYGAKDYLLKPVVRKELIARLADLRSVLDARRKEKEEEERLRRKLSDSQERLREQFWLQAVRAGSDSEEWMAEARRLGIGELAKPKLRLRFATIGIQDQRSGTWRPVQDALLLQSFYMLVRELAELWEEGAYVFRDPAAPERLHLVFQCGELGEVAMEKWLEDVFRKNIETLMKVQLQMGISDPIEAFQDWRHGFISSRIRWMQSASVAAGEDSRLRDVKPEHYEIPPIVEKQLTSALEEGDREAFLRSLRSLLNTKPPLTLHGLYLLALRLLLLFDELALKRGQPFQETQLLINALPESLWPCRTPDECEAFFARLGASLMDHIRRTKPSKGESIIERIVEYLKEHYTDEDISLSDLARRFHLHVTYLSELFKKTTGKNYSEYITEIRMEKAKELMEHSELKISDIAEMTGFSNANYFSQVFKKMTGMSPNEYRTRKK